MSLPTAVCHSETRRSLAEALAPYGIELDPVAPSSPIPGTYWGEPEAGLIGNRLFVRADTPLHSALHEACHFICMDPERRSTLHTDAGGDLMEENAVCYLQGLLADALPGYDRQRLFADMDAWGYTFRLGSASAWFDRDADDARCWLLNHHIIDPTERPTGHCRY